MLTALQFNLEHFSFKLNARWLLIFLFLISSSIAVSQSTQLPFAQNSLYSSGALYQPANKTFPIKVLSAKAFPTGAPAALSPTLKLIIITHWIKAVAEENLHTIDLPSFSEEASPLPDAIEKKINTRLSIEDIRELLNRSR